MPELVLMLHAGLTIGTILLFAAVGEILAERAGVMNLGIEGLILVGAMAGMAISILSGSVWLGLLGALAAGALLTLPHAVISIHLQGDQVVSGLTLTFFAIGVAVVLGADLTGKSPPLAPSFDIPGLAAVPLLGPIFFKGHSVLTYIGYALAPSTWYFIRRTRPGLHLRTIGEEPVAADALGISVYRLRYLYVIAGGSLAGLAGATVTLSVSPGWSGELTTLGQGWIAIALVLFSQWRPIYAAIGAYFFGVIQRGILDLQGFETILGVTNPFFANPNYLFFLKMSPFLLCIVVLVIGSHTAMRKRLGAPAALGIPYVRGEHS